MTFLYKNEYIPSFLKKNIEGNKELHHFCKMTFPGINPLLEEHFYGDTDGFNDMLTLLDT